jgi:CubicO group peptidase (beta-lactamase class C family)
MISNPNLKAEGNGYGMGWYLYGENPNYGNVIGHNGSQTGASTFLMLLPEVKTTIIVLSNTSGAMQAISTITVKLFDIAHNARK